MNECPKCKKKLEYRSTIEDPDNDSLKDLYYCNNCDEHVFILKRISTFFKHLFKR